MMVLASVYVSVSASLPFTPGIKPVEFWLLLSLSYPFFIIVISILQQVVTYSFTSQTDFLRRELMA